MVINMKIENLQTNELKIENKLEKENNQRNFFETVLGRTINSAIDLGLRYVLPDFLENEVINIKNNLLENGLKEGIQKSISDGIDTGKSAIGIVTGNFETVSQMQRAVERGGVIDGISDSVNFALNKAMNVGLIDNTLGNILRQGKNVILNGVERNINTMFNNQIKGIEKIEKNINDWRMYYSEKDFINMEKEYSKIKYELKNLIPLENILKEAREIENLHSLIKNNGNNFDLTNNEIELTRKM